MPTKVLNSEGFDPLPWALLVGAFRHPLPKQDSHYSVKLGSFPGFARFELQIYLLDVVVSALGAGPDCFLLTQQQGLSTTTQIGDFRGALLVF